MNLKLLHSVQVIYRLSLGIRMEYIKLINIEHFLTRYYSTSVVVFRVNRIINTVYWGITNSSEPRSCGEVPSRLDGSWPMTQQAGRRAIRRDFSLLMIYCSIADGEENGFQGVNSPTKRDRICSTWSTNRESHRVERVTPTLIVNAISHSSVLQPSADYFSYSGGTKVCDPPGWPPFSATDSAAPKPRINIIKLY